MPPPSPSQHFKGVDNEKLRIDTGGWSVNYSALFYEVSTKCSLTNYYMLNIIG